tara:strand:- start:554 stop:751 length:198 start_codon:yes stop_codon:yes gene_type:complete
MTIVGLTQQIKVCRDKMSRLSKDIHESEQANDEIKEYEDNLYNQYYSLSRKVRDLKIKWYKEKFK